MHFKKHIAAFAAIKFQQRLLCSDHSIYLVRRKLSQQIQKCLLCSDHSVALTLVAASYLNKCQRGLLWSDHSDMNFHASYLIFAACVPCHSDMNQTMFILIWSDLTGPNHVRYIVSMPFFMFAAPHQQHVHLWTLPKIIWFCKVLIHNLHAPFHNVYHNNAYSALIILFT